MKNLTTAALLLISVSMLAPQASFAGKPDGKPVLEDCVFVPKKGSACTIELYEASVTLEENRQAFISKKADSNYFGLRCKVAAAEVKMMQKKRLDAFYSLEKSVAKIWTLFSQRKIETYDDAELIARSLEVAMTCAGDENYVRDETYTW